jgi:hypothetical protein
MTVFHVTKLTPGSECSPTFDALGGHVERSARDVGHAVVAALGVALQVAFERQTLKPVFSLDRL